MLITVVSFILLSLVNGVYISLYLLFLYITAAKNIGNNADFVSANFALELQFEALTKNLANHLYRSSSRGEEKSIWLLTRANNL
jgi:hypothetical protein